MATREITLDEVLVLAQRLKPTDQARLIVRLVPALESALDSVEMVATHSRLPVRGILADLGPAPSAEDIDEVQREMWALSSEME